MSDFSITKINEKIEKQSKFVEIIKNSIGDVIVGQNELIDKILIGVLSKGHLLLEGVPGLAKTLTVNVFARAIETNFQRIQFTPDMLPADLLGTLNEKQPPFLFFLSSHIGFISSLIINNIQFFTSFSGTTLKSAIISSTVLNFLITL